jgi:crossover junction endodeoxyribonuclease RuvC
MKKFYLGIDAGFSGAIAILLVSEYGTGVIGLMDMPLRKMDKGQRIDLAKLKQQLKDYEIDGAILEKAQAMPAERTVGGKVIRQGIASTAKYMQAYGEIYGLLVGLDIPIQEVHPATWKKAMMKDMPKGKEASIIKVQQLYPKMEFKRKKDHGMADAILIGLYGIKLF